MDKDICTMLIEIKAETQWSQPRLADELKVSQPTVNRILRGQSDCMASTLTAIANLHKRICARTRRRTKKQKQETIS